MRLANSIGAQAACLLWLAAAAYAQTPMEAADPDAALRALCDAPALRRAPLNDADAARCQQLFQTDIATARARQEAFREKAIADLAARKARGPAQSGGPVPLSSFVDETTLVYGDIVTTDDGPRVYVGRSYELAKLTDFVTLDAPRSPHRKRAAELLRAMRPR